MSLYLKLIRQSFVFLANVGLLIVPMAMVFGEAFEKSEWQCQVLVPGKLAEQSVEGVFNVLPQGGPSDDAVIEFADPISTSGKIEIDLSDIDMSLYDQLRFGLWMEHDAVNVTATLQGYPNEYRGRRWYVFKRFQPLRQWIDIRLDLDMDDDMSGKVFAEAKKSLVIDFKRPDTASADFARARIHNIRLVRSPLKIGLDYRQVTHRNTAEGLKIVYPIQIENTTEQPVTARLEVLPETLDRFKASPADETLPLAPGESKTTYVEMAVDAADLVKLPTGHVERAQVRAWVESFSEIDAMPIRGFRPIYLFGFVPPARESRDAIFESLKAQSGRLSGDVAPYEKDLLWEVEKPPTDVTSAHSAQFRCPECKSWLGLDSLYTYFCYSRDISGQCPLHNQRFTIDKNHRLFPSMLNNYHSKTLDVARNLAMGWLRTGDERLAKRATEILVKYQSFYGDLPVVAPSSVAFQSRFSSASLFERHLLKNMIDTWLILQETGAADPEVLREIADGLILDSLNVVNQFYYSFSASQIDMVTQALQAAIILEKWTYAADAIGGDSGVQRILQRNFNTDGVPIDGGDYARQAARQIMVLADSLQVLGIAVDEDRMRQIEENCRLLGYLSRPDDYKMKTTVLDNTGFTVLVNGEGPTWRRATINWGSTRERGGHDHLTTVLYDADDSELLLRTRRVMWGHPHANLAFQSFAQNIPVVDQNNISGARLSQVYLMDDSQTAGVIICDQPERPAYPDSRLTRSLVLFEGCLLVADRFVSSAGKRLVDFPLNGLAELVSEPEGMEPFSGELGEPSVYRLPHDLKVKKVDKQPFTAQWVDGKRGVKVHVLGDGFQAYAGKTYMGQSARSVPRDFLMMRTRAEAVTAAFLYEATHGDQPKVSGFAKAEVLNADGHPVGDNKALAFDVTFDDSRIIRVLISLDGGNYRSGACSTDAGRRITLQETKKE